MSSDVHDAINPKNVNMTFEIRKWNAKHKNLKIDSQ
jgi:hypothetical protein